MGIKLIVERYEQDGVVVTLDKDKRTPVHVACNTGCSVDVVKYLVDKYPETLSQGDAWGWTPLHLLCFNVNEPDMDNFKIVSEKFPGARTMEDKWGWTPFQIAKKYEVDMVAWQSLGEAPPL